MMDKWQKIHSFWSQFGIPAYDENAVPDHAQMPYITYYAATSDFEKPIALYASVWYRSTSWQEISQKADEIRDAVSPFLCDPIGNGEYVFVTKGTPFAQRMNDEDSDVKRIYINIDVEFFTHK